MGSISAEKPHAVMIPYPAQGHITPMLQLAKLLYTNGFHITFVNTEYNQKRLVRARGEDLVNGVDGFNFETIPDGLPPSDIDATQDIPSLCDSTPKHCLEPFRRLLQKLNASAEPKVTCIVSDGVMSFTLDAAEEIGVPEVLFWTTSACGFWAYVHYKAIIDRGIVPLQDESGFTPEFLDTPINFISGMDKMRLRDIPSFIRTTNIDDIMPRFILRETSRATRASAIILNTFDELEKPVLDAMASVLPPVFSVGPLFERIISMQPPLNSPVASLTSSLWKEDPTCIDWLQNKEPGSVLYVNFGSITVKGQSLIRLKSFIKCASDASSSNVFFPALELILYCLGIANCKIQVLSHCLVISNSPYAVLVPYPAQGHITAMLQVAKLLHSKGFHNPYNICEH